MSKTAGGIGVAVSNIRAKGSYIRGANGYSNGLVPLLRNFNETARYVDQGGGKRKGSFARLWSPGMLAFSPSWSSGRTMERRSANEE